MGQEEFKKRKKKKEFFSKDKNKKNEKLRKESSKMSEKEMKTLQRKHLILALLSDPLYVPMKEKEIAVLMQVSKEERAHLSNLIGELEKEGNIEISPKGKITLTSGERLVGTFVSHAKGFGFVVIAIMILNYIYGDII